MLSKSKFYLNYTIKISIILLVLFGIHASTSKMETYSTNENINKSIDLSTMAIYINKEEEARKMKKLFKHIYGDL